MKWIQFTKLKNEDKDGVEIVSSSTNDERIARFDSPCDRFLSYHGLCIGSISANCVACCRIVAAFVIVTAALLVGYGFVRVARCQPVTLGECSFCDSCERYRHFSLGQAPSCERIYDSLVFCQPVDLTPEEVLERSLLALEAFWPHDDDKLDRRNHTAYGGMIAFRKDACIAFHEYTKHGSCAVDTPEDYVNDTSTAYVHATTTYQDFFDLYTEYSFRQNVNRLPLNFSYIQTLLPVGTQFICTESCDLSEVWIFYKPQSNGRWSSQILSQGPSRRIVMDCQSICPTLVYFTARKKCSSSSYVPPKPPNSTTISLWTEDQGQEHLFTIFGDYGYGLPPRTHDVLVAALRWYPAHDNEAQAVPLDDNSDDYDYVHHHWIVHGIWPGYLQPRNCTTILP